VLTLLVNGRRGGGSNIVVAVTKSLCHMKRQPTVLGARCRVTGDGPHVITSWGTRVGSHVIEARGIGMGSGAIRCREA
jgi:hypothetical protein